MKTNYLGIVAGIIAFISLALPWWTLAASAESMGIRVSVDISAYPYQLTTSSVGVSATETMEYWFGWAALAFIVLAGIAGIVGSTIVGKNGKKILFVAGILALLSILTFAAGLQYEFSKAPPASGLPKVGLFSSGSFSYMGSRLEYLAYPSFGFWLALAAALTAFISPSKHPMTPPVVQPTLNARAQLQEIPETRYCIFCGERITVDTNFCPRCGKAQE